MTTRMLRLGLSFIVGLGCWLGRVQAQAPADPPAVQMHGVVSGADGQSAPVRQQGPARDCFTRFGYLCGQNHNWYGCGGWHAQNTFVFGSCRVFFGEPCMPQQPHERVTCPGCGR